MKRAQEDNCDKEAYHLAKAAKIVRRDILQRQNALRGTFPPNCQNDAVPSTLQTLFNMIIKGPTVDQQPTGSDSNQACMSVAHLLMFNSISRDRNPSSGSRHTREKECPLPIYVALKIHGATRGRSLIDAMFGMGLCISYDRLLALSTDIANSVCTQFENDGVVCPPKLRGGLFTTAAVDNIDHNPSSTSAMIRSTEQLSLLRSIQQVRYLESIGESIQFNPIHQLLKLPERWHNFQLTFLRYPLQC